MEKREVNLILWRHADAMDGQRDLARELTETGLQQARNMARWLNPRLPTKTRVISSPAARAKQTALALTRNFEVDNAISPGAGADAILAAVGWPVPADNVVVVGHQPALGESAAFLLCGHALPWSIKKGAVWWFVRRIRNGESDFVLQAVMSPRLLL